MIGDIARQHLEFLLSEARCVCNKAEALETFLRHHAMMGAAVGIGARRSRADAVRLLRLKARERGGECLRALDAAFQDIAIFMNRQAERRKQREAKTIRQLSDLSDGAPIVILAWGEEMHATFVKVAGSRLICDLDGARRSCSLSLFVRVEHSAGSRVESSATDSSGAIAVPIR